MPGDTTDLLAEIARAESPRGELVLRRRSNPGAADVVELRVNGVFVMDTLETSTEIEMAGVALDLVDDPRDVVIGGLGLGFTLQRILADVRVERATVVEIEESLVGWMRDGTVPHGPALLADQRVRIVNADILMAIAEARDTHDLLLLDVDNGPGYLVHDGNADVYGRDFLARCRDDPPRPGRARRLVGGPRPRAPRRAGGRLRRRRGAVVRRAAAGPPRGVLPLRRPTLDPGGLARRGEDDAHALPG